jgi:hypothetical protein
MLPGTEEVLKIEYLRVRNYMFELLSDPEVLERQVVHITFV